MTENELKKMLTIDREVAAQYGRDAVEFGESGYYVTSSGKHIEFLDALERAVKGTVSYPPDTVLFDRRPGSHVTNFEVVNQTTLHAAKQQLTDGYRSVVLNFASATSPGGGFLRGARAQEEYLARSSGLFHCLRGNPMYKFHRENHTPFYTDYVLYSPDVPVFREDDGTLMEEYFTVGIVTSAAVNARWVAAEDVDRIVPVMWSRILKVLAVGLHNHHDAIVLGAWGCGAFGNDPDAIAGLFKKALSENFLGAYRRVTFAITDWSEERRIIGPFERKLKGSG